MTKKIQYFTPGKILAKSFQVLDFQGEFHNLLGKPAHNFSMIVYGKSRAGKSTLIIKLADYLALTFGKVLYIAAEELMNLSLQKTIQKCGIHSEEGKLKFVATRDLAEVERAVKNSRAHFIVIDTAQKCGFTKETLYAWQKRFMQKAFIIIMQSDRAGEYKGDTAWSHDTDIKVKCEAGHATAEGRFDAPTGKMHIFNTKTDLFNNSQLNQ